jgi:hypothetical protein
MCRSALLVLASWFFVFASAPASAVEGPAGNAGSASVPGADAKGPNVEQAEPAASRADPNATRLLLGPTARSLRSGEAYFDLFTLTIPFAQVGLTDRFSVGVGAPVLIPGVIPGEVFFVTPKLQLYEGGTTALAVGVLHIHDGADNRTGIAYGVVTRGTADAAVTAVREADHRELRDSRRRADDRRPPSHSRPGDLGSRAWGRPGCGPRACLARRSFLVALLGALTRCARGE